MNENTNTGIDLGQRRALARLKQSELATQVGYGYASSISEIERTDWPKLDRAKLMAHALGITLDELHASISLSHDRAATEGQSEADAEAEASA